MARIYLSSTYQDLVAHREAVYRTLRQLGHDVIAMEDYVATDERPLKKCLADVDRCDLYVGFFAWRYGFQPPKDNPEHKSITELEYLQAKKNGHTATLVFLLNPKARWPRKWRDTETGEGNGGALIERLRHELGLEHTASFFTTPDNLAKLVSVAVTTKLQAPEPGGASGAGRITAAIGDVSNSVIIVGNNNAVTTPRPSPAPRPARRADPKARRAYLKWVVDECAPLKLKAIDQGAARPGTAPLGLTNVYVDLNLDLRIPARLSLSRYLQAGKREAEEVVHPSLAEKVVRERVTETRLVPALEALAHHEKLVLLGPPGSGKSTLAAYVALSLAEAASGRKTSLKRLGKWWNRKALLPVRVVLRQFAAFLSEKQDLAQGRAGHLWEFIESDLTKCGLAPAVATVPRAAAQQSGALFLLDGLDEVREETIRARVLEAVAEFTRSAGPRCRFLLAARPYAWDDFKNPKVSPLGSTPAQLAEMHAAYRLADFEPEQVQDFIARWYKAIQAVGWISPGVVADKTRELKAAAKRADLERLARNPLLLTLMATLHSNRAKLPDDRADLYNEVVKLLLQRWNENIGMDRGLLDALNIPTLTLSHLRKVIQTLAFEAHAAHVGRAGVADIPEGTLLGALRPLLANDAGKADLALDYIEKRAGLLLGQGEREHQRQYTFPHRTFQEFLAACHLAGRSDFCRRAEALARDNPAHWREVLTLAARRAEADRGVPVADALVHCLSFKDWSGQHSPGEIDWRVAVLAGEQLTEIGLAVVASDPNHCVVQDRVASWLTALLEQGALPAKERAQAGLILGKLGDPHPGVGLGMGGLPDLHFVPSTPLPAAVFKPGQFYGAEKIELPYRITRYPVTVAQFQAFVDDHGYERDTFWTPAGRAWRDGRLKQEALPSSSFRDEYREATFPMRSPKDYHPVFQTPNHPRVGVSWYEATAFCAWVSEKLKQEIRLSRETEWEQAARWDGQKADHRTYPWGEIDEGDLSQRCNWYKTGIGHTSAVDLFRLGQASCGAFDMSGNVWEWCQSGGLYLQYGENPLNVVRGGSWDNCDPNHLSVSYRNFVHAGFRSSNIGFRCVLVLRCPT